MFKENLPHFSQTIPFVSLHIGLSNRIEYKVKPARNKKKLFTIAVAASREPLRGWQKTPKKMRTVK